MNSKNDGSDEKRDVKSDVSKTSKTRKNSKNLAQCGEKVGFQH
jgi:hypothetical protein